MTVEPPEPMPSVTHFYFGTDWDPENRTSAHHVARWLGERYRVLYFECPGMRAPRSTGRDVRRIFRKLGAALLPPRRPSSRVEVRTLVQLPFHRIPGIGTLNRWLLIRRVRALARRERARSGSKLVTWFLSPHVGSLAGELHENLAVQYCVDDYAAFPGVDRESIAAMDAELSRRADLVFVTSDTMLERKRALAKQVAVSPHGVDVEHFRRAAQPGDVPAELRMLVGPVIGFFGLIEAWIDLDLVGELARRHPEWNFVMIGRIAVPAAQVPVRPNLLFTGAQPYQRLPDFGRRFDVSIIPYRLTQQVRHANPIKLREYLAMERPIVSVATPEIEKFAELVKIATTVDEWERAILSALAGQTADRAAMRAAADAMAWNARLERVNQIVNDALAGRPFAPPPVAR